jgi:trehalose synthase
MGTRAWGLQHQIRDGLDGRLVSDPTDPEAVAQTLEEMLGDPKQRFAWGLSGQRRVYEQFLIFTQVRQWLCELATSLRGSAFDASHPQASH